MKVTVKLTVLGAVEIIPKRHEKGAERVDIPKTSQDNLNYRIPDIVIF